MRDRQKQEKYRNLRRILAGVFGFEIIMILLTALIVKPLIGLILKLTLTVSGYQLAFNDFILGFFLTVPGLAAGIVILLLAVLLGYFEYAVIIHFVSGNCRGSVMTLNTAAGAALKSLKRIRPLDLPGLMIYLLLLLPVVQGGISGTLLPGIEIPNFISGELFKYSFGKPLYIAIHILLFAVFLLLLWVLPLMVTGGRRFTEAVRQSAGLVRNRGLKMPLIYGAFVIWKVIGLVLEQLLSAPIFHSTLADIRRIYYVYGFTRSAFMLTAVLLVFTVLAFAVKHIMLIYLAASQGRYLGEPENAGQVPVLDPEKLRAAAGAVPGLAAGLLNSQRNRRIAAAGAILVVAVGGFMFFVTPPELHEPIVIGHRGSLTGVENSQEAIQGAIDAGADYAEIDVFLSADGVPVVVHDANLKRLTGDDAEVAALTAAQLQEYQLVQGEYQGRISTLDEILTYCKGKIKVAIELKSHGQEEKDLAAETLKVIDAHQYLDQVIFLSLNYELIAAVQQQRPEAVAGYCVYRNIGALQREILTGMDIDFVVIEEAMAGSELVHDFRKAWIPVYVWTVNDAENMQRYLEMGSVGIITDYPAVGVEMVSRHEQISQGAYLED